MPATRRKTSEKDVQEDAVLGESSQTPKRRKVRHPNSSSVPGSRGGGSNAHGESRRPSSIADPVVHHDGDEIAAEPANSSPSGRVQPPSDGKHVDTASKKPAPKPRRNKAREEMTMPLASRTQGLRMMIGAHVSCAKGVHNSVNNALHIGGNAFAMFLKSQRKWDNPPLQDEHREMFLQRCHENGFSGSHVLPHGSYLVNLAQADPDKALQAYNAFVDDLKRCDALGIKLYNFHPGSTGTSPRPSAIGRIAAAINRAHAATTSVVTVLESMAGSGNVIGSTFDDLRDIIAVVADKSRVGVCLDTCHVFAAGYDLRSLSDFQKTMELFERIVGFKYLRALHLNDSKAPLASHRDLHQNIGVGFLGLRAFHNIMNDVRFENIPLILETPIDSKDENGKESEDRGIWAREIKLLESLAGMDSNSEEFKALETELSAKGESERMKFQETFDKKMKKQERKADKEQTKLAFGHQV